MHKRAKKGGLDLEQYNILKREIAEVEYDLKRLRDPLQIHLPANPAGPLYQPKQRDDVSDVDRTNIKSGIKDLIKNVKTKLK